MMWHKKLAGLTVSCLLAVLFAMLSAMLPACSPKDLPEKEPTLPFVAPVPSFTTILPYSSARAVELLVPQDVQALVEGLHPQRQGLSSWLDMRPAIQASLDFVQQHNPTKKAMKYASLDVQYGQLAEALEILLAILPRLDAEPHLLAEMFIWLRIMPDIAYTGYYEPALQASRIRTDIYRYPLYRKPTKALRRSTRHQIDRKGVLRGKGLEIAWLRDPFDAFTVHVQGSGKLVFTDGTEKYLLYAGNNGWSYVSLGRILRERGMLDPENVNMDSIKASLEANPQEQAALYDVNPRYIYFKLADTPPVGSMGSVLTPWVSVATDKQQIPLGAIAFMQCDFPIKQASETEPFAGLMLAQDSGYAIQGNRVDIFCGSSQKGKGVASYLNATGALVMLLPKSMFSFEPQTSSETSSETPSKTSQ